MSKLHLVLIVLMGLVLSGIMIVDYKIKSAEAQPQAEPKRVVPPQKEPTSDLLAPFLATAKEKNLHVLWFLSRDGCLPCARLERVLNRTKEDLTNFYLVKTKDSRMNDKFGVKAFPTLVVTDFNGKELARTAGFQSDSEIKSFLKTVKPPQK